MMTLDSLVRFYDKNVVRYGNDIRSVAWGSRASQVRRFEVLAQVADLNGSSVLDVGCGLGDFYCWLRERYPKVRYTGVDITPSMVRQASLNYPEAEFIVRDILRVRSAGNAYDYVFASGIFNKRVPRHEAFVKAVIRRMFAVCKKGVAFNIMSTRADYKERDEYYADPSDMLKFCMSLSGSGVMRHDYMPHDFTVYIYKEGVKRCRRQKRRKY